MSSGMCFCVHVPPKEEQRRLDNIHYWRPQRIGNSFLLCGKKNTAFPQQCFVGPEWPCMVITNILIIVPTYFFIVNIAADLDMIVVILAIITVSILLVMFAATACSEPGIIWVPGDFDGAQAKSAEEKLESGYVKTFTPAGATVSTIQCGQCQIERPRSAAHCYECGLCVDDLDHHCPWTGKCIAKKNLQRFHGFLYSLCFHLLFVVSTLIYSAHIMNN